MSTHEISELTDASAPEYRHTQGSDHIEARLAQLEAQFENRIEALEAENERLQERVGELEAENEELRAELEEATTDIDRNSEDLTEAFQTITPLRKLVIGEGHSEPPVAVMKQLREEQGPLNQQLGEFTQKLHRLKDELNEEIVREVGILRSQQNARIRQLATETGVELELTTGDQITRVREDGIDAVCASPRKRDRRAERVLQHIEEWGTKEQLRSGSAYRLPRPRVKRLLNGIDSVGITMTSKTVGDVFDAIEKIAAGTTRLVQRRKQDGVEHLYVGFPETTA